MLQAETHLMLLVQVVALLVLQLLLLRALVAATACPLRCCKLTGCCKRAQQSSRCSSRRGHKRRLSAQGQGSRVMVHWQTVGCMPRCSLAIGLPAPEAPHRLHQQQQQQRHQWQQKTCSQQSMKMVLVPRTRGWLCPLLLLPPALPHSA